MKRFREAAKAALAVCLLLMALGACCYMTPQAQAEKDKADAPRMERMVAPALIPGTRSEMNSAGFWIGLHPFPDRVILNRDEIRELNGDIRKGLKTTHDLASYPMAALGGDLREALTRDLSSIGAMTLYLSNGDSVDGELLSGIEKNMGIEGIPQDIKVRFGFVVKSADQRRLPTAERFYPGRISREFDMLQAVVLDIGVPIAVLHTSADGNWHYVVAPYCEGWIADDRMAFCSSEAMRDYLNRTPFIVVTTVRGDVYLDPALTDYCDRLKMGARLPMVKEHETPVIEVTLPRRDKDGACLFVSGYLRRRDTAKGFLAYTPRNIILQAFEFLNDPYGWGDLNGEQDCSSFIRRVFATTGIELPRNSLFQSRSGKPVADFKRETPLEMRLETLKAKGIGGMTLLWMKGHIMLYLGMVDGTPYAIQAMWSYMETVGQKEVMKVVNRIVVTNLFLGKDTRHGSYMTRLGAIRNVEKY
ncbi:MAG: SH3 domain-containing protein [Deltaproteobacteria bacterium]|nr:SH3 domain-containing protein [Deltaproteobacteria bacterium]